MLMDSTRLVEPDLVTIGKEGSFLLPPMHDEAVGTRLHVF